MAAQRNACIDCILCELRGAFCLTGLGGDRPPEGYFCEPTCRL